MKAKITPVMDWFNFEEVHRYMVETEWVWWHDETQSYKTPSLARIKKTAKRLLISALKNAPATHQSGGFIAKSWLNEDNERQLELYFYIEHSGTE